MSCHLFRNRIDRHDDVAVAFGREARVGARYIDYRFDSTILGVSYLILPRITGTHGSK